MASAAGIIIATGVMTAINKPLAANEPLSGIAGEINWKVIPATAIAAGIFYGLQEAIGNAAVALAALAFFTASITEYTPSGGIPGLGLGGIPGTDVLSSPLGTLMKLIGQKPPGMS